MSKRKHVGVDERIAVKISLRQQRLLLNHVSLLLDQHLEESLREATTDGNQVTVRYTLSDIDDLLGCIAAAANHEENRKVQQELDGLYDRIRAYEDQYHDDLSAPEGGWRA